jgi:hypothetical protein
MTRNQIAIVVACISAMLIVAAYVLGQDTPPKVPAGTSPAPSYTPFTHTPDGEEHHG